ncbi:hypothetical protein ACS0TY_009164 [Phlomoides rotata]
MRSIEDKGCLTNCPTEENPGGSCMNFEFQKSGGAMNRPSHHHRTPLGKPTPSKWDDAQKWLVNLSRGEKSDSKASPRNSNADDRRLIAPVPKKYEDEEGEDGGNNQSVETKNVDCDDSVWRSHNKAVITSSKSAVRSICLRDMGTEMTPIASKEPSRAATPIKATSPVSSGSSTPVIVMPSRKIGSPGEGKGGGSSRDVNRDGDGTDGVNVAQSKGDDQPRKLNPLETRAAAWEEAERTKYMARYKREEARIQAWQNHQMKKVEMDNRKVEMKAERMKSRAKEAYNSRTAATRRIAEEKRANAEAKLNEKAMQTSERADYIRRTGHLPYSFSFKLPSCSCCW